jgi:DNA-binding CsgD family transcriptional regulator
MGRTKIDEALQERVRSDPEAFQLYKFGSDNLGDWRVRSGKYGIDESFLDVSRRTGIYPFKLHCLLEHQARTFTVDGISYSPVSADKLNVRARRGTIRRTFRGIDGTSVEIIKKRLGLTSDAEAVREAVRIVAQKLTQD